MSFNWLDLVFAVSFCLQIVLWTGLYRLPLKKNTGSKKNKTTEGVSIVVCAKNEFQNLSLLLPRLLAQNYPSFEIILMDDQSTDKTSSLLHKIKDSRFCYHKIDTTPEGINSKKHALSTGIKLATFDLILVTDADCLPFSTQWVAEMVDQLSISTEIVLGISPYFELKNKPLLNQIIQYETTYTALQMASLTLAGVPYMGLGRNMLYRKGVFLNSAITTTQKHILGGDDDLLINEAATKTNTTINLSVDSFVYSYPKKTLKSWIQQKRRHLSVSNSYSIQSQLILLLINLSHACFIGSLVFGYFLSLPLSYIIVAYVLRTSLLFVTFNRICKSVKGKVTLPTMILGDILFPFYLFTLGILSIVFKTNTWK